MTDQSPSKFEQNKAEVTMKLPARYLPATWRNTTAVDHAASQVGIGFRVAADQLLFLRLSLDDCRMLAAALTEALERASEPAPTRQDRRAPSP